ncbi:hypothetical protein, partial [Actinotalea ferrariae]|uniref:hypothetical protein n=1 Tax=Actinotalea ferrariae TaxID=1386098 RepID=UPI0005545F01
GPDAPSAGPAAPPQNRSAMFSGFRSRRAELAAAAVDQLPDRDDERPSGDGADRLAAAAATLGRGSTDVQDSTPPADVPVPLVIPVLEDDDEYPPSLLGAVGGTSGGRHAVREDDLVWPPAVDDAEDTWGGPVEQEQPSWTGGTAWQQPEPQQWTADPAPVEPVADAQPATWEPTQPTQPTWQAEPAQPTWQ